MGETNEVELKDSDGNVITDWNEDPEIEEEEVDGGKEAESDGEDKKDTEKEGEEEKGEAGKAGDDESGEGEEEGKEAESEEEKYSPSDEIRELRRLLRSQNQQMKLMEAKLGRADARSAKALKASEEDEDEEGVAGIKEEEELSNIERLSNKLKEVGQVYGHSLEILAETMEQNPKYADLREVCSRTNFDDIFDAVASEMAKEGKGNEDELRLEVELSVWQRTNPYKYMYDLIKSNHPKYAGKEASKVNTDNGKKTPKESMKSLAGTDGGSGSDKGAGWTAAKIDVLPEDELDKVPVAIYEKYLAGELK